MSITAMKAALEALEWGNEPMARDAITALRAAIAEQEKCEPVAWMHEQGNACFAGSISGIKGYHLPLYTHPAPVPADWKLVPVEPTPEMITAANPNDDLDITWQKMIAAAPKPGEMK